MATTRPWADLSPDLLLDVSGRLRDAADFVRFHAVCRPWRDSTPLPLSPATTSFLPRPAAPRVVQRSHPGILHTRVNYYSRRPSPAASSHHRSCASLDGDRNWVASADGTAAWLFHAADADEQQHPSPRLLDLLTGAVTPLPPFTDDETRQRMANPRGVVYGDGTVLLYSFTTSRPCTQGFTAALLRPGDATWTVTTRRFLQLYETRHSSAAYHDGTILLCALVHHWCLVTPGTDDDRTMPARWWYFHDGSYRRDGSYVLESRGELLWASVLVDPDKLGDDGSGSADGDDLAPALSLKVSALKLVYEDGGSRMHTQWVKRDGPCLGDRVLFLGSPASFAVDAAQLDVSGGCVYFFFRGHVWMYSLLNGKAELVERLPPGWGTDEACVWLSPQPTIAPLSENRTMLEPPNKKQKVSIS